MHRPLISVMVPFYNMEAFLEETVQSVIGQTYDRWELLLIDDGSQDQSSAIAQRLVQSHPDRIRYYTHEGFVNKGLTATRSKGLAHANGEYGALLDADDVWLRGKLERQVEIANHYPEVALIGGATEYWHSWRGTGETDVVIRVGGINDQPVSPPAFANALYPLGTGSAPCMCSVMFKTDVARRLGGFEQEFSGIYQMYEDQAFMVKWYLHEQVYMSSECLDRYRQRPNSMVTGLREPRQYATVRGHYLDWLARYLDAHGIDDPLLMRQIARARWKLAHPFLTRVQAAVRRRAGRLFRKP